MYSTAPASALTAEAAAIIRAIQRAMLNPPGEATLVRFTVTDVYASPRSSRVRV